MAEPPGLIEVRELTKRFGDKVAVDHLSFTIEPGRVTGFLGPDGVGKSTTMRLVCGLTRHIAIATVTAMVLMIPLLVALIPGTIVNHIHGYLPTIAGQLIGQTTQQPVDVLSPWQGFGVFCAWTAVMLAACAWLLMRRDAVTAHARQASGTVQPVSCQVFKTADRGVAGVTSGTALKPGWPTSKTPASRPAPAGSPGTRSAPATRPGSGTVATGPALGALGVLVDDVGKLNLFRVDAGLDPS